MLAFRFESLTLPPAMSGVTIKRALILQKFAHLASHRVSCVRSDLESEGFEKN